MEEKTQSQAFLGTEPVGKLLFRLALPAIAAQLINVLYNMVDRMYIGHIPGVGADALITDYPDRAAQVLHTR